MMIFFAPCTKSQRSIRAERYYLRTLHRIAEFASLHQSLRDQPGKRPTKVLWNGGHLKESKRISPHNRPPMLCPQNEHNQSVAPALSLIHCTVNTKKHRLLSLRTFISANPVDWQLA